MILLPESDFDLNSDQSKLSKAQGLTETLHHQRHLHNCRVTRTQLPHTHRYETRYFALLKQMDQIARIDGLNPKWYIIGDDDTIWLDDRMLRRELSNYDPDEMWFCECRKVSWMLKIHLQCV